LCHPFFARAEARLPPGCILPRLVSVYVQRSYNLWVHPEDMQFLYDGAREVLCQAEQQVEAWLYDLEVKELARHSGFSPLEKYCAVSVSDYGDEWPRLPPEINPLDPALADPAVARRGRLRLRRALPAEIAAFPPPRHQLLNDADQNRGRRLTQEFLDPNLPLLELFWRSFLPWNAIDSSRINR